MDSIDLSKEIPDEVFKSAEERYMCWWLMELYKEGYIKEFNYEVESFELSDPVKYPVLRKLKTKTKTEHVHLMHKHIYTPDFKVVWTAKGYNKIYCILGKSNANKDAYFKANLNSETKEIYSLIEVKPSFDQNNMTRLSTINIKWVYAKYGVYIQTVIPTPSIGKKGEVKPKNALFNSTFIPTRYFYTDSMNGHRKIRFFKRTITEFLNAINS
jgi:hypothetical protein